MKDIYFPLIEADKHCLNRNQLQFAEKCPGVQKNREKFGLVQN